jgi:hypothetical protein
VRKSSSTSTSPAELSRRCGIGRKALQEALDRWKDAGRAGPITVTGRTARKEAEVVFVVDAEEEVEVQAGWWIWVPREDVKAALEELGIRIPW